MQIELTNEQAQNLSTFMRRVQLTGEEVPAFYAIMEALSKAMDDKQDK